MIFCTTNCRENPNHKTKRDCNSPPFIIRSVYVMNPLLSTSRENQSRKEIKPQETPITEIN